MKFLLKEYLLERTPYMIRNDGRIFQIKHSSPDGMIAHPYILLTSVQDNNERFSTPDECIKEWEDDLVYYNSNDLYWFYIHTNLSEVKKLISLIVTTVLQDPASSDEVRDIMDLQIDKGVQINGVQPLDSTEELWQALCEADILTNQEFLRLRTSDLYRGGQGRECYFRVGSRDFNWFPIMWDIVYQNRDWIESITIESDEQSGRYQEDVGMVANHMPVEEFINLPGRPVVETLENK